MTTTWTALAGDTSVFGVELSLTADPDDHRYDPDEQMSWGSLTLWVDGVNLTEHLEQGELLRSAHWYLLPTIEWIVGNWDALLHEERLPLNNADADAASAMTRLLIQPLRLVRSDLDEFERLERWQSWWSRHNIVDSVAGGIFPDVYIRRWGDLAEISAGASMAPGVPSHFRYQNVNFVRRVPVANVASAFYDVLQRAVAELLRRRPESARLAALSHELASLTDDGGENYSRRLALLSGVDVAKEDGLETFERLWAEVDETLGGDLDPDAREFAVGHRHGGLVLETAPQVALLFGSYNPSIVPDDVQVLIRNLHTVLREGRSSSLPELKVPPLPVLSPGQEGSQIGETAYSQLTDAESGYVDVARVMEDLGISYSVDVLTDANTRAVSLVSERYGYHVVVNRAYLRGTSERVLRFTLAHELGHILLDKNRSVRMAMVSGPWAPIAVEQRANAFAAAFLMPEELIARHAGDMSGRLASRRVAEQLAARLRVSLSSLADRMYNLLLVTREEADALVFRAE
jgi:Zn-dependent peptidase ImmA (M78 family)